MSEPTLKELRCDDCAFTPGTQANSCSSTRLKTKLCVDAAVPFYCHKRDGLCAGWAESVNTMDANGHYVRLQPWQKDVLENCLEVIAINEDKDTRGDPITEQSVVADIMNVFGYEHPLNQVREE